MPIYPLFAMNKINSFLNSPFTTIRFCAYHSARAGALIYYVFEFESYYLGIYGTFLIECYVWYLLIWIQYGVAFIMPIWTATVAFDK